MLCAYHDMSQTCQRKRIGSKTIQTMLISLVPSTNRIRLACTSKTGERKQAAVLFVNSQPALPFNL